MLRGIRRTIGTAPDRKSPATADVLTAMTGLHRILNHPSVTRAFRAVPEAQGYILRV